jgi:hypothetical protein
MTTVPSNNGLESATRTIRRHIEEHHLPAPAKVGGKLIWQVRDLITYLGGSTCDEAP